MKLLLIVALKTERELEFVPTTLVNSTCYNSCDACNVLVVTSVYLLFHFHVVLEQSQKGPFRLRMKIITKTFIAQFWDMLKSHWLPNM